MFGRLAPVSSSFWRSVSQEDGAKEAALWAEGEGEARGVWDTIPFLRQVIFPPHSNYLTLYGPARPVEGSPLQSELAVNEKSPKDAEDGLLRLTAGLGEKTSPWVPGGQSSLLRESGTNCSRPVSRSPCHRPLGVKPPAVSAARLATACLYLRT